MHGRIKRLSGFRALSLASVFILLHLCFCARESKPAARMAPVDVQIPQKVRHSAFQSALSHFEAQLSQDVAGDSIGSISAGVVVGTELVWAKGFGWADVERQIPADAETVYRIGSISKSFTAVAMAQLVEKGLFSLDDPVERFFPEIKGLSDKPENAPPVTFRNLASHTAGLIREPRLRGAAAGPIGEWENKILESIPETAFQSLPGERYSYSNIGFGILGLAISRTAGIPFMDMVTGRIFKPLGMQSSFFILTPERLPHLSMGYVKRRDGTVDAEAPAREHAGRGYKVPNGGIYSTVGDMAKFIAAMTGASPVKILSDSMRREMLTVQTPEGRSKYGLGFSINIDKDGFTTAGHGGSVAGYNAHIVFDPQSKTGVILLRNYNGGKTSLSGAARTLLKKLAAAGYVSK